MYIYLLQSHTYWVWTEVVFFNIFAINAFTNSEEREQLLAYNKNK